MRERSSDDLRVGYLRLSKEGERRLAQVFRSHEAEREKLREMLVDLERTVPDRRRQRRR